MSPKANLQTIADILVEQLGCDPASIKPDSTFTDLGADSLDEIEIVRAFEEEFAIDIDDEDAELIKTVQQALDYLKSHT